MNTILQIVSAMLITIILCGLVFLVSVGAITISNEFKNSSYQNQFSNCVQLDHITYLCSKKTS